jgi:hypothetical protein
VATRIGLAALAAFACAISPVQAQPLPPSEREVLAFGLGRPSAVGTPDGPTLLRPAALDWRSGSIPVEAFPEELRARVPEVDIHTNMVVSLDAQAKPVGCRPTVLFSIAAGKRVDEPLEGAIGERLCAVATGRLAYHPALAADGTPVAGDVSVAILYRQEMMAPPAPMPPASWVVSKNSFPPPYFSATIYRGLTFTAPKGHDFAPSDRRQQRKATVDLLLTGDASGAVTDCRVAVPSGYEVYDSVSCAAARTIRVSFGERSFALREFPLRMRWNKRKVELVMPLPTRGPQFVEQPEVRADLVTGIELPAWAETSVELSVSPQGALHGCTLVRPSYIDALDIASCAVFGPDTRFTQPMGVFGDPAEGRLRMRIDWNARTMRRDGY